MLLKAITRIMKFIIIRSGAQSGVDRAALDYARKHNIEMVPEGRLGGGLS